MKFFKTEIHFVHIIQHFLLTGELMEKILHRMPLMEKAEIRSMINGPESFTPDSRYLLGEVPEVGHNPAAMRKYLTS